MGKDEGWLSVKCQRIYTFKQDAALYMYSNIY